MALSNGERKRLENAEDNINNLAKLAQGGGSKNQLNRLLVLAQDQNRKLTARVVELESQIEELLDKVRKLQ